MSDQPEQDAFRARIAEIEAQRVPLNEVMRWFLPWIVAGILALVFFGGLWCASTAADDGTYGIGLAGAAVALLALIWELAVALRGGLGSLSAQWLVDDETSLVILAAVLTVLALAGLVLASRAPSAAAGGIGYGLFFFALVFVAANLKHYFDQREG